MSNISLIHFKNLQNNNNYINILKNSINKKRGIGLIHKVYTSYLRSVKQYKASSKTKSEVRGGGRKPWKQKGTGRARAGSIRSPLWVGGGVSFGPKPKKISKKINKKEKQKAISIGFWLKQKSIKIISQHFFKKSFLKTKFLSEKLKTFFEFHKKKTIAIITSFKNSSFLSARNLKNVKIYNKKDLTLKNLLNVSLILFVL